MNKQLKDPAAAEQSAEIEYDQWRVWVAKNHALDKRRAAKKLQFIVVALAVGGLTLVAAALYRVLR